MKIRLHLIFLLIPLFLSQQNLSADGLSIGIRYGHSRLFADYADPGSAVSADLALRFHELVSAGFQFSYNIYQPLPACEIFGGDCRWNGEGDFTVSEYFPYIRLNSPAIGLIPARIHITVGGGYFRRFQDITYSREDNLSSDSRALRRDNARIGFIAGAGMIFDDFKGVSLEFSPVLKLVDDIEDHLDIYFGLRYTFQ
jgi:hypothetical protein